MPKHAKQQPSIPIFGSEEPLATVLAALEIEGNDVCFDCDRSVVGDEWLSAQHGTVHCIQCAGVHRSLGVHVSFVRSLRLDTLKQAELVALQLGGNAKFREWLEAEHGVKRHVWLALPLELPSLPSSARYPAPQAQRRNFLDSSHSEQCFIARAISLSERRRRRAPVFIRGRVWSASTTTSWTGAFTIGTVEQ